MRGSSRGAALKAEEAFQAALTSGADLSGLAEDLFAVSALIDGNASLRRALADPSGDSAAKRALATRLLQGRVSAAATTLVGEIAAQRWAGEADLGDTVETLGVSALLAKAEKEGRIAGVEDELFRFDRIVAGDPGLRDTLGLRNPDAAGKGALVEKLLAGRAAPETVRLAQQAVRAPRGRRLDRVLGSYLALASVRRDELSAQVLVAKPLSEQQSGRLAEALTSLYGKPVTLQTVLDPEVVGGIRVQVGDEVIDGTVLRRLEEARRHLAG